MNFYTNFTTVGDAIYVSGYNDGEKYTDRVEYLPKLYTTCQQPTNLRDFFDKKYLMEREFQKPKEFRDFIKQYQDLDGFIWGNKDYQYQYILERYGLKIDYDQSIIRGALIDIEVMTREKKNGEWIDGGFPTASEAAYPINAICHYDTVDKTYYLFLLKHDGIEWCREKSCFPDIASQTVAYQYDTEPELLRAYIKFWQDKQPDYISGWNVDIFDIPYIVNRYRNVFNSEYEVKKLSPVGIIKEKNIKTKYGVEHGYTIYGVSVLDYMALYKKFTYKVRESYSLDFIGKVECGVEKKKFVGTHGSFYWEDLQGFADYNLNDVFIVVTLNKKTQLLSLAFSIAYFSGINYEDVFSPIRTWENLIFRKCFTEGVVTPIPKSKTPKREEYEGAFVIEPVTGKKRMVVSVDFTSLYPSIIRTINISADSLIQDTSHIQNIKQLAHDHGDVELEEAIDRGNIRDYNVKRMLPEYVHKYLADHQMGLATNCTLYDQKKYSKTVELISEMFVQRKADKKTSFNWKHKAMDIEEELKRRGLK